MTTDLALGYAGPDTPVTLGIFTLGSPGSTKATGLQKTVFHWLRCLFTQVGSDPTRRAYGTGLASLINSSQPPARELLKVCSEAVTSATQQIIAIQLAALQTVRADERLASVRILSLTPATGRDGFSLSVELVSAAGTRLDFIVPVLREK